MDGKKIIHLTGLFLRLLMFSAAFIVPLAFHLNTHESFEMPKSAAFFSLTALAAAVLFVKMALKGEKVLFFTPFSFPAALLGAAFAASFISGALFNPHAVLLHWQFLKLCLLIILFYLLIINVFTKHDIPRLLFVIITSHFIVAAYGVLQYFHIDIIKWVSFGEGRVYSTLGNPDYMAAQFSVLIPVLIAVLLSPVNKLAKFFSGMCVTMMFFLVIVSQGRGAWLGFLGSLAYMFLMLGIIYGKSFFSRHKKFFVSMAAFLVLLIILFTVPNPINRNPITERIKQSFDITNDSVAVRLFYWESALQMAAAKPFFGAGIGGFSLNTAYYQRKVYDRWLKAAPKMAAKVEPHVELYTHNDFLQTLAENGFLGFGVYLLLFFSAFYMALKLASREENIFHKNLLIGITASIAAFLINGLLNFPWRVAPTLILLWSLLGIFSLYEKRFAVNTKKILSVPLAVFLAAAAFVFIVIQARVFYANALVKHGQAQFAEGNYAQARDTFEKSLASNARGTDRIELVLYAGNAYNALLDTDTAIKYYNRGLEMFPNFIESHYNVANVYMSKGMKEKALEEYEKTLALNPKFTAAMNNMANLYFNTGNFEKAKDMYKRALDVTPSLIEARYNLGACYYRMKDYRNAKKEMAEVLKYDPNYQAAKQWVEQLGKMGY